MKLTTANLRLGSGIEVQLIPAFIEPASVATPTDNTLPELTATIDAPSDLVTSTVVLGGAPTMVGWLPDGDVMAGYVLVRGMRSLAGVVFDVAGPSLQPWLDVARRKRYLPIALRCKQRTRVVRASVGPQFAELLERSADFCPMQPEQAGDAMGSLLRALDDPRCLADLGVPQGQIKQATLALCMSMLLETRREDPSRGAALQ